MIAVIEALDLAAEGLAALSNALWEVERPNVNAEWADAAVDRALLDLEKMREWLEDRTRGVARYGP